MDYYEALFTSTDSGRTKRQTEDVNLSSMKDPDLEEDNVHQILLTVDNLADVLAAAKQFIEDGNSR